MNIYKTASEIQFANEDGLRTRFEKMTKTDFPQYISILSQIHADMKSGKTFDEAIDAANLGMYANLVKTIINDIGLPQYSSSDFASISSALQGLRATKPDLMSGFIPGFQEEEGAGTPDEILSVQRVMDMEFSEMRKYLQGLSYPEKYRKLPENIFRNVISIYGELNHPQTPSYKQRDLKFALVDAVSTLLSMASGEFEVPGGNEEPEGEIVEETVDKPKTKPTSKVPFQEDTEALKKERKEKNATSSNNYSESRLEEDEIYDQEVLNDPAIKESVAKNNNPYIDFSSMPPVVDYNAMTSVYGNFLTKVDQIFVEASKQVGVKGPASVGNSIKRQFNDLAFSIKMADHSAYKLFKEQASIAPKEHTAEFKTIESQLASYLPSQLILENQDDLNRLYLAALYLSSPKLANLLYVADDEFVQSQLMGKNKAIQPDIIGDLKNTMIQRTQNDIQRNIANYFDLESKIGYKNLLKKSGLRWETVLAKAIDINIVSGPEAIYRPCPTCYKYIKWSADKSYKKRKPFETGFRVRLYSFFTGEEDRPKITKEYLDAGYLDSGTWPAPSPNDYDSKTDQREQGKVIQYAKDGGKSWSDIQALLTSGSKELQEEGWHRRSGALRMAGGVSLATKAIQSGNLQTECPFSDSNEESDCGISFQPVDNPVLPGGLSLQPTWNGLRTKKLGEPTAGVTRFGDELWKNKELLNQAKGLQRGGLKFSKMNFACTCRIKDVGSLTSYKHGNLAISKPGPAGTNGFLYPTKPDGSLDIEIANGTLAMLVCGAPTSISSFDRSPESTGYILNHFMDVKNESMDDYKAMINYLIRNGLNVNDVMSLDQNLDEHAAMNPENFDSPIKARMNKILRIIKTSASIENDSEIRRLFGGLTLVCPFGHRFTIGHSLKFGEMYAGIFQSAGIASAFSDIITSEGDANIRALLQPVSSKKNTIKNTLLVPANHPEMDGFIKLPYEEWILAENRTVFPQTRNKRERKRPILMFSLSSNLNGDMEDFVFYKKSSGAKDNVWPANNSFTSKKRSIDRLKLDQSEMSAVSNEQTTSEGNKILLSDLSTSVTDDSSQSRVSDEEYNYPPSRAIPGTNSVYNNSGEVEMGAFGNKVGSLSRALKSSLRVIEFWSKSIVNENMMTAVLKDRAIDISLYSDNIGRPLEPYFMIEGAEDEVGNELHVSPDKANVLKEMARQSLIDIINRKAMGLSDSIRSNIYLLDGDSYELQISKDIVKKSILELMSLNIDDEEGNILVLDVKRGQRDSVADNLADTILRNNEKIIKEIIMSSEYQGKYEKDKMKYIGRASLVAYATYLSGAIVSIYKKYLSDPSSNYYVGYDIGIDLSSVNKIMGFEKNGEWIGGISEQDVQSIVSTEEEALNGRERRFALRTPEHTLRYEDRIDRAWIELETSLKTATREASSSRSMEMAKDYIVSRMTFISGGDSEEIRNGIANVFPTRSLLFNGTTNSPETGVVLSSKKMYPVLKAQNKKNKQTGQIVAHVRSVADLYGSERVEEWIVRDTETNKILVFESKEEADAAMNEQMLSTPDKKLEVRDDSYLINPRNGYDGSKVQIGITGKKPGLDLKWPPEPGKWGFVGFNLPFYPAGKGTSSIDTAIGKMKLVPIRDYRFEIDFDGEPLDISFLMRRRIKSDSSNKKLTKGETVEKEKSKAKSLKTAELKIEVAHGNSLNNIRTFKYDNHQDIMNDESIFSKFLSREKARLALELEPHIKFINSFPLQLRSDTSYVDSRTGTARPMLRAVLEDPISAYRLVMNPELRGKELSKGEKESYIKFIIRVYNIDLVRDMMRSYSGRKGKSTEHLKTVTSEQLLSDPRKYSVSHTFLGAERWDAAGWNAGSDKLKRGYVDMSGDYFSLNPGSTEGDSGSFMQYVYSTSPNVSSYLPPGKHPNIKSLVGASRYVEKHGLDVDSGSGSDFSQKIEDGVLDYISSRTSGERKNPARDGRKSASEYTVKISLRRSKLDRMILSLGIFDLSDAEMPKY